MDNTVKWFIHLTEEKGIISSDVTEQIVAALGDNCELLTFAETVIANGFAEQETVQEVINEAWTNGQEGPPPESDATQDVLELSTSPEVAEEAPVEETPAEKKSAFPSMPSMPAPKAEEKEEEPTKPEAKVDAPLKKRQISLKSLSEEPISSNEVSGGNPGADRLSSDEMLC